MPLIYGDKPVLYQTRKDGNHPPQPPDSFTRFQFGNEEEEADVKGDYLHHLPCPLPNPYSCRLCHMLEAPPSPQNSCGVICNYTIFTTSNFSFVLTFLLKI